MFGAIRSFLAGCVLCSLPAFGQSVAGGPSSAASPEAGAELLVLGTLQDGGSPHLGCMRSCCKALYGRPDPGRKVVSLALLDLTAEKTYLFEATPDIAGQMALLQQMAPFPTGLSPDGIFLTHAHIGHYAGLMYLGKESLNARGVPVFALPSMQEFLAGNGPWDQLLRLGNITLAPVSEDSPVVLTARLRVIPIRVPHRDEYSETVGFEIVGPSKRALFIPDIDKWDRWKHSLSKKLMEVDLAFLDGTFFDAAEVGHRDIREIPHPLVTETMALLEALPGALRSRVYFIHLNHTNPLLDPGSEASRKVRASGFRVARVGDRFQL